MTEPDAPSAPPKRTKHVTTHATSRSLRLWRGRRPKGGERLVDIARRLRVAESTLHHWAKEDGFRRKDVKARASLAHGPRFPGKADYPELKEMGPRALAAIEAGFLDYGLKWLREAQKLERGWAVLREHLADFPPTEEKGAQAGRTRPFGSWKRWRWRRRKGGSPNIPSSRGRPPPRRRKTT